jgi:hypothetical protein
MEDKQLVALIPAIPFHHPCHFRLPLQPHVLVVD